MGLPMISFDITTGPNEIIKDGKDGYLIPPYDIQKMAERIEKFITDEEQRVSFSKNTEDGIEKFEKKQIYDQWVQLIEELTREN